MLKQSRRSSYVYYLRRMELVSFGRSEDINMITVYLKGMMHYMFISKVVNQRFVLPLLFDSVGVISFPTNIMKNTLACMDFLFHLDLEFHFIRHILVLFVMPVSFILITTLISKLIQKISSFCHSEIFTSFAFLHCSIFIFTLFQPNAILDAVSFMSCRKIGEKNYIVDYLDRECYTK